MTQYVDTQGTVLKYSSGASPEVFTTIPQIVSIDGPTISASERNTTHLGSTAVETRSGLKDYGTLTCDMFWDERDTAHAALRTLFVNKTVRNFKLIDAGSPMKTYTVQGWIRELPRNYQIDNTVRGNMVIRLTGAEAVS